MHTGCTAWARTCFCRRTGTESRAKDQTSAVPRPQGHRLGNSRSSDIYPLLAALLSLELVPGFLTLARGDSLEPFLKQTFPPASNPLNLLYWMSTASGIPCRHPRWWWKVLIPLGELCWLLSTQEDGMRAGNLQLWSTRPSGSSANGAEGGRSSKCLASSAGESSGTSAASLSRRWRRWCRAGNKESRLEHLQCSPPLPPPSPRAVRITVSCPFCYCTQKSETNFQQRGGKTTTLLDHFAYKIPREDCKDLKEQSTFQGKEIKENGKVNM